MAVQTEEKLYDEELQRRIKELAASGKTDITTIAKGINKSPSTLSLYLKNGYNGKIGELEHDLKNFLTYFEKKENTLQKHFTFHKTTVASKLFKAAAMCQMLGKMGVCYGEPGIGKTTAINEYKKDTIGVIVVDPFEQTSIKSVLMQIADQLKINYDRHGRHNEEITNEIVKKLAKNKSLIIIDEAENLKIDVFKVIRKLHDKTQNSCGVLFAGTHRLQELLMQAKKGFPYISSRIGYVARLEELKFSDIKELTVQYYPDISEGILKVIASASRHNARHLQNLLDLCFETTKTGRELTLEIIEEAKEYLLI